MQLQHGRGRIQEDLISHLKQQIAGLDQHTKSLMKMTLYRISRNANASVCPIPHPPLPNHSLSAGNILPHEWTLQTAFGFRVKHCRVFRMKELVKHQEQT